MPWKKLMIRDRVQLVGLNLQLKQWRICGKPLQFFRGYGNNFPPSHIIPERREEATSCDVTAEYTWQTPMECKSHDWARAVLRSLRSDSPSRSLAFTTRAYHNCATITSSPKIDLRLRTTQHLSNSASNY
jgi:hypothetical protein